VQQPDENSMSQPVSKNNVNYPEATASIYDQQHLFDHYTNMDYTQQVAPIYPQQQQQQVSKTT